MSLGRPAGQKKTGGRKRGVPNKKTQAIIDQLVGLDCDPIEGMATVARMSMEKGDLQTAGSMYKELCQYIHPKRKAIEVSGDSAPLQVIIMGNDAEL